MAVAVDAGFEPVALSFDYGQRHRVELDAARKVAQHYRVERHLITPIGLFRDIGGSALTDEIDVPTSAAVDDIGDDIPVTYVPARNLVFLSMAVGVAETVGAQDIFIGVNALDYSGYPDCRPEFIEAFAQAASIATKVGAEGGQLTIHTPLIDLSKAGIVKLAHGLDAPLHLTHSCYAPSEAGLSCGSCDSCLLRLKGFEEAGLEDPIAYEVG
jgi:7-cyano-7-deazaguanine synthase